jgi:hypothetical protein
VNHARLLICLALLSAACSTPPDVPASRIVADRVLGVVSDPAEVNPGESVRWTAIVASPHGFTKDADIDWAMCMRPRGPSDPITVAPGCLGEPEHLAEVPDGGMPLPPPLVDLDSHAISVEQAVPFDICSLVGSEVPLTDTAGNPQRPPDPDVTGGYQMAVRLELRTTHHTDESFVRQRIHCRLNSAPADAAGEYAARYVLNTNPELQAVYVGGVRVSADGEPSVEVRERRLKLVADWHADQRETYVLFDPITHEIVERQELLTVSWFTDAGEFDVDRTNPDPGKSQSTNTLVIDSDQRRAHVWVLLRDDRGGLGYATFTADLR